MKKIFLLLLTIITLTACGVKANPETDINNDTSNLTTSLPYTTSTFVSTTTPVITTTEVAKIDVIPPSYEEVSCNVDEFFMMFYANNQEYKLSNFKAVDGSCATGYFAGDSLVKVISEGYADIGAWLTTYYFIDDNLIYITSKTSHGYLPPFLEDNKEYFLIDEKLWQYSYETNSLVESSDTDKIERFKQVKYDIEGSKPQSFVKNTFSTPKENNVFVQFSEAKNSYFRKFFFVETYEMYNNSLMYYYYPPITDTINALFNDSELLMIRLGKPNETSYTGYEYYFIDDTRIYVVMYYQEFESNEVQLNEMKKNYYKEFFIVNDIVMIYDTEKQDLVESPENQDILTYYNTAIEKIED